jgi:hypothetical protein
MKKLGATTGPILASALFAAAIVSGCAFTTVIPLEGAIENPPRVAQVPLVVGVHYRPEFRAYEYARYRTVVRIGQSSVTLLDQVLPMIFERVVRVSSPPPPPRMVGRRSPR